MKQILLFLTAAMLFSACTTARPAPFELEVGVNPLFIPELIDSRETSEIELTLQNGSHEFFPGIPSKTRGFNGSYLGPTIRLYNQADTTITFRNEIGEPTTVHGHGLHVRGELDGGPQSKIMPGESWKITIPVRQEAGLSWYHPHLMGKTAEHVHSGLAGLYIIEDEVSERLNLPKVYGVNDLPLVIQDRSFTEGKMNEYKIDLNQLINGLREDTIVVNGTLDAYQNVPKGWVRLRLLNASNARFYRFSFHGELPFVKIATEGGFLEAPVEMTSIEIAPGERNEIMIDLSSGTDAILIADLLPVDPEDRGRRQEVILTKQVLELRVDPSLQVQGELPETLNDINFFERADAVKVRTFHMGMDGINRRDNESTELPENYKETFTINGHSMKMMHVNEEITLGDIEIWKITGERMPHPFHVHGVSFQILTQNGKPPAPEDRGWKDTVVVREDEVTEIILRFDHEATMKFRFMYHCHMLEHEEGGMMGQFTVLP
jgi:blue copper oxidase